MPEIHYYCRIVHPKTTINETEIHWTGRSDDGHAGVVCPPPEKSTDLTGPNFSLQQAIPEPFGRAEVLPLMQNEDNHKGKKAEVRSGTCVKTLCIQRYTPSPASGAGKFYVYHRDGDNSGWSALITEISWFNDLPSSGDWASFTFYDEQNQPVCIDEDDVIFVMEAPGAGASPYGIKVTICTNGVADENRADPFVIGGSNYTWGRYCHDLQKNIFCTQSSDKSACNDITFSSSGDGTGTVRFLCPKNGDYVDLPVPSQENFTWPGSPLVGMWHFDGHDQTRATGGYTRNCPNPPTYNDYGIAGTTGWHGVILNRWENWCYLHY